MARLAFISINFPALLCTQLYKHRYLPHLMTTTQKIEELSNIKTGSEMIYKSITDAANFSSCAGNKMLVRVGAVSTGGSVTFPAIIPLRPPCCYTLRVNWTGVSTGGSTLSITLLYIITQLVSGGVVLQTNASLLTAQNSPNTGSSIAVAKNATSDSLDVTLTIAMTGTATSSVECEVTSAANF